MADESGKSKYVEEVARQFFSGVKPEDLPSVDTLIRALALAKGAKYLLSPNAVKRFLDQAKKQGVKDSAAKLDFCSWPVNDYQCNPCDWKDVCLQCDWEDVCVKCDALDCNPGFGPDIDNPAYPKP